MSGEPREQGGSAGADTVPQPAARSRSIEERRRLVAESLQVGNPGNRARDLPEQADPRHDCQIELRVEDIRAYEHNPRRANNAKFAEIKDSIRATGIRNPLTVTRRPGEKHFIVEAGGNTRLLAIQQLWVETRDTRFEKLTVLFRPWRSEAHVLTAHLIENEQRGELTFWDKANGVFALKTRFEEEKGRTLSLRQLEEELKSVGFSVTRGSLTYYLYATTWLRTLGEAIPVLSGLDVRTIQVRLNLMKRYAQGHADTGEVELYEAVFEPVFLHHATRFRDEQTFNASQLCQACEAALAQHLDEDIARLRMVLDALSQSPQASIEAVLEATAPPIPNAQLLPAHDDGPTQEGVAGVNTVDTLPQKTDDPPLAGVGARPLKPEAPARATPTRLRQAIVRLAQLATVAECLHACDAAPLGYYMELPAAPFEEDRQQRLAARAWWLLARISGQFNERVRARLPEDSRRRELGARAGGLDQGDPGLASVEPPGIGPLDSEFFDWLLDANDEAANACWEVLIAARASAAAGNR